MKTTEIVERLLLLSDRGEFRELGDCGLLWLDKDGTALWQAAMSMQRTFPPDFDHPVQEQKSATTER